MPFTAFISHCDSSLNLLISYSQAQLRKELNAEKFKNEVLSRYV